MRARRPRGLPGPGGIGLASFAQSDWGGYHHGFRHLTTIWNLPVQTLEFGLNGVDVFVGYTDDLDAYVRGRIHAIPERSRVLMSLAPRSRPPDR